MDSVKWEVGSAEIEFDFERLSVYQKALSFVNTIFAISDEFPNRVQYSLGDQLRRAVLSVVNNIAEGSGKRTAKEKLQFYHFALNSARECVPMLTVCREQVFITHTTHDLLRTQCFELCRMLRGLSKAVT